MGLVRERAASALAEMLKQRRLDAGLKQMDLAYRLHRSQGYVSKYEMNQRKLTLDEVAEICDALGIPLMPFLAEWASASGGSG